MTLELGCIGQPSESWATTNISGHLPDLHFSLVNDLGVPVTEANLRDKKVLLYFGYTGCGLQCPLILAHLARLAEREKGTQVVFVTVTPVLDPPPVLHAYLSQFGSGLVGLTGPTPDLENLARQYRVAFPVGSGPDLPHGNLVYVFDGEGKARLLVRLDDSDQAIRHDLSQIE